MNVFSPIEIRRIDRPGERVIVMYFAIDRDSTALVGYVEDANGHRHARLWIDDWNEEDYPSVDVAKFLTSRPDSLLRNPTPQEFANRVKKK